MTANATAEWMAHQLREAFPSIVSHDICCVIAKTIFGDDFWRQVADMKIQECCWCRGHKGSEPTWSA